MINSAAAQTTPDLFAFGVKRDVTKRTNLRAYPGWYVLTFKDEFGRETFGAYDGQSDACSPLEGFFADAVYFVRHGEPIVR